MTTPIFVARRAVKSHVPVATPLPPQPTQSCPIPFDAAAVRDAAYRCARSIVQHADAEDAAQDAVLACLEAAQLPDNPAAFAARAARNAAHYVLRRRKTVVGRAIALDPTSTAVCADERDPELPRAIDVPALVAAAEVELGEAATAALAFLLAKYTQVQIADALGITRQAVQRLLARACSILWTYAARV